MLKKQGERENARGRRTRGDVEETGHMMGVYSATKLGR